MRMVSDCLRLGTDCNGGRDVDTGDVRLIGVALLGEQMKCSAPASSGVQGGVHVPRDGLTVIWRIVSHVGVLLRGLGGG